MSKELEALYRLTSHECMTAEEFDSLVAIIKQALTPPTEQEVCEALSEYLGGKVIYEDKPYKLFAYKEPKYYIVEQQHDGTLAFNLDILEYYPPHLITLIGRFYEGRVSK